MKSRLANVYLYGFLRVQALPAAIQNLSSHQFLFSQSPGPYGLAGDILWLGHCGANPPESWPASSPAIVWWNDTTVPPIAHRRFLGGIPTLEQRPRTAGLLTRSRRHCAAMLMQ